MQNLESTLAPPKPVRRFESFPYARPDLDSLRFEFEQLLRDFEEASDAAAQAELLHRINAARDEFWTMYNLCYIR
ncbi:MAG TPA: hypothetical protein PKL15_14720, partial [Saprospiraceae bacterium]|nr:hypothetical protein [Saprospiraceae bacterium]